MKVTRVYPGKDGESHFEDVDVPLEDSSRGRFKRSKPLDATSILFSVCEGHLSVGWHTTPRRQYIIILEGEVELGVSDGNQRKFGPGNILLLEDTTGRGHTTHSVDGKLRKEVFVALE